MAASFGKEGPFSITNFSGCCGVMPKPDSSVVTSEVFLVDSWMLDRQAGAKDTDLFTGLGYMLIGGETEESNPS